MLYPYASFIVAQQYLPWPVIKIKKGHALLEFTNFFLFKLLTSFILQNNFVMYFEVFELMSVKTKPHNDSL